MAIGDDDPLPYYYHPIAGWLYRRRLTVALQLMSPQGGRCLDLGCGSGIFLPSLSAGFAELHGLDLGDRMHVVQANLAAMGVTARLERGSVYELPYKTDTFDSVVAISMMEHLHHLDRAVSEIARVLKPTGEVVLGFPARGRLMTTFFSLIRYSHIDDHHVAGPPEILRALRRTFVVQEKKAFPAWCAGPLRLYFWVHARPQDLSDAQD